MTSISPTPLLDLAEIVSTSALIVTKSLLKVNHAPASIKSPESPRGADGIKEANGGNDAEGVSGLNGIPKGSQGPSPPAKELILAKQALNQAASELLIHAMGPDNYLKSFSYGVSWPVAIRAL